MKRAFMVLLTLIMVFGTICCFSGCDNSNEKENEIALIYNGKNVSDGAINETTWKSIKKFCKENGLVCKAYSAGVIGAEDESGEVSESVMDVIKSATKDGSKVLIFPGSDFEEIVYEVQEKYKETKIILIDGVPHDSKGNYNIGDNTICALFAEEQAGYVAGYAAVEEGYTNLGFMGGKDVPSVKRFGYGFIQGADAAAKGKENKEINIRYTYTGSFEKSKSAEDTASAWYAEGTEVIFACGGAMGKSIMKAAENNGGKVIGVDVDQSKLSDTVITSAKKCIGTAVEDVLKEYVRGNFKGGNVFAFSARNDGISMEMENDRLEKFDKNTYNEVMMRIISGNIKIKKDTEIMSPDELKTKTVKIKVDQKRR